MIRALTSLILGIWGLMHIATSMADGLTLTSTAFKSGQPIPAIYTCEGKDQIPDLSWSGVPNGSKSLALILSDPDAPAGVWMHWVVFNIPASLNQWRDNSMAVGSTEGNNSWDKTGYRGPCPPAGQTHRYLFTLYALDTLLDLSSGATANQVLQAAEGHLLGQAQLIATYKRSH